MIYFFTLWAFSLLTIVALMTYSLRDFSGAWIAYTFEPGDGTPNIYLLTGDGAHRQKISDRLTCAAAPQWSANGRWIAFSNSCAGTQDLLRIRPGGGGLQVVSNVPSQTNNARWSPDREQVAVVRGTSEIYIVNASGGERFFATDYYFPQWSPDGDWIYARPLYNDRSSLDRLHVTTGEVESVLPPRTVFGNPSCSPDAHRMVIAMPAEDRTVLLTMNPDGGGITVISDDAPEPTINNPIWSPDGEWIAFVGGATNRAFEQRFYRIRPDGSGLQRLSDGWTHVENLQWSPDSQWLLFTADVTSEVSMFRLRADGSSTNGLGWGYAPQVAPTSGLGWNPFWLMTVAVVMGVVWLRRSPPR
jgi:Tol biopolymer transport system component